MLPRKRRTTREGADADCVFVDSSAWIALFSMRDQHHSDADRMFRDVIAVKKTLYTSNLVLAEIHRLLLHRAGERAAAAALERIEASPQTRIKFADAGHHKSAGIWLNKLSGLQVSYADAISFAIMEATGCRAVMTFDRHFVAAGFTMLPE